MHYIIREPLHHIRTLLNNIDRTTMSTRPGTTCAWTLKATSPTTPLEPRETPTFRCANVNECPAIGDAPPHASNSHLHSRTAPPGHCTTHTTMTAASAHSNNPRRPCGHTNQPCHHTYPTLPMCQLQRRSPRNRMRQPEVLHLSGDIPHCRPSPSRLHEHSPTRPYQQAHPLCAHHHTRSQPVHTTLVTIPV